jgi:SAM-dependent methyltransferase
MLARARDKVPEEEFHEADLHDLPMADDSVDLVVCAIALTHVPELTRALAELVRVLRPNGHLVISDSRGLIGDIGPPLVKMTSDGGFGYMPTYARLASDYLAAALPLGLQVRRCEEPRRPSPLVGDDGFDVYDGVPAPEHVPGNPPNIWALHRFCTDATNAAWRANPAVIVWLFQFSAARPARAPPRRAALRGRARTTSSPRRRRR